MENSVVDLSMDSVISYSGTQLTAQNNVNCCIPWNWGYWDTYCRPYYTYPVYQTSRIEQSFKIVSKLIEMGIIDKITLKKFIELVGKISELL